MEDIRVYLDSTEGAYHKGETHAFASFSGLVLLVVGGFWVVHGLWFALTYGSALAEVAGSLQVDPPSSAMCWFMTFLRALMGAVLCYLGVLAWDMRRVYLYASWILLPLYMGFWGWWYYAMDPTFRSSTLTLGTLTSYPLTFFVLASIMMFALLVVGGMGISWVFRPSRDDPGIPMLVGTIAVVVGGIYFTLEPVAPVVRNAALAFSIAPIDHPKSGHPMVKLVALSNDELMCHENMDALKDGLERLEESGRKIQYSAYDDRPGGERLVRMIRQLGAVDEGIACPSGGWYRVIKEVGTWRCNTHGDRLDPEDRTVAGLGDHGTQGDMGYGDGGYGEDPYAEGESDFGGL